MIAYSSIDSRWTKTEWYEAVCVEMRKDYLDIFFVGGKFYGSVKSLNALSAELFHLSLGSEADSPIRYISAAFREQLSFLRNPLERLKRQQWFTEEQWANQEIFLRKQAERLADTNKQRILENKMKMQIVLENFKQMRNGVHKEEPCP